MKVKLSMVQAAEVEVSFYEFTILSLVALSIGCTELGDLDFFSNCDN